MQLDHNEEMQSGGEFFLNSVKSIPHGSMKNYVKTIDLQNESFVPAEIVFAQATKYFGLLGLGWGWSYTWEQKEAYPLPDGIGKQEIIFAYAEIWFVDPVSKAKGCFPSIGKQSLYIKTDDKPNEYTYNDCALQIALISAVKRGLIQMGFCSDIESYRNNVRDEYTEIKNDEKNKTILSVKEFTQFRAKINQINDYSRINELKILLDDLSSRDYPSDENGLKLLINRGFDKYQSLLNDFENFIN